jgi:glycosyltransferase involved in cell wall biosynthesis
VNILYVSEYFYPRVAGGEIISWQFCAGLADRGHKIYVITSRMEDRPEHEVIDGVEIFRPLQSAGLSGNNGLLGIDALFKRASFAFNLYPVLKKFIRSHQIDLIYNVAYIPTLAVGRVASALNIPVITAVFSICGTTWFKIANPIVALMYSLIEIFVIRFGKHDVIHSLSNYAADKVRAQTSTKIVIIPPPVDTEEIHRTKETTDIKSVRQRLGIEGERQFLLFVGSLTSVKNVVELVTALSSSHSDFKLILVGEGPERHRIKDRIKKLDMGSRVLLLGQLPHPETLRLINSCDALIMASKTETFGIVVLEALAMDRPVIAAPVGCVPEISSNNIYMIRKMDEINKIIESDLVPNKSYEAVEKFALSIVISRLEQLCEAAVSNRHNSAAPQTLKTRN